MLLARAVALGMLASSAATPLPTLAGRTLLVGCRQGECRWLSVSAFDSVTVLPQGELRRLRARAGSSYHPDGAIPATAAGAKIAWEKGTETDYAFCSRVRPAYAFTDGRGRLTVHFLDLFDLAGYQYSSAELYMRLCHGLGALPSARALRAMGYRPRTRSGQIEARGPEIMTRF
jgi:hypothetical protein